MTDLMIIIGLTLASCLAVGLIGLALLHLLRYRSLRQQLTIATLLPVVAVATTVWINVQLMFLSAHDSLVILIALLTSLLLAALGAWLVVRRIARASRRVGAGLHQLVSDSASGTPVEAAGAAQAVAAPRELATVLDDLAETRRTLAESRARERAAERSRQELVSFMSHDLRTPLTGLRALSEGLEDGVIDDVPRAMSQLRATVARMSVLVDDLFALSRVQGTREAKPQTMVSLTELISDVASESAATARRQGVRLEIDVPENDRLAVLGSSDDLARALTNLTTNAIRHTDRELVVRLEGRRTDDGHVRVAVSDSCGGIPQANLSRVFDAGWRGTPSRSDDDGGAGLGLAIARGVVESHGGEISVSNIDGGCRFELALPVPETSKLLRVKVLLTGAAGFVGRPVHDQLLAAGHTIRAFDRVLDRRDDITDHDRLLRRPPAATLSSTWRPRSASGSASRLPVGLTPLNIGTPWVMAVGEMAAELSRSLSGPAPAVTGQYRLGDVRHITADCSAAERVLGWRAQIDLATGLADLSASVVALAAADADRSAQEGQGIKTSFPRPWPAWMI